MQAADGYGAARKDLVIAAALFVGALLLRVFDLGGSSLWVDEAASATFARAPWSDLWGQLARLETNPPGYYSVVKAWISVFGVSDVSLRMPSAIASALCVIPIYYFALREYGRGAAILAASLVALSAIQVQYGQEARSFAMISLFFVTSLYFAGRIGAAYERERFEWKPLAGLVLAGSALPFMHYTGYLALAVVFVYLFTFLWLKNAITLAVLRDLFLTGMAILLLTAPVLSWISLQMGAADSPVGWIPRPSVSDGLRIYRSAFGHDHLRLTGGESQTMLRRLASRGAGDGVLLLACVIGLFQGIRMRQWSVVALCVSFAFLVISFFLISQVTPVLLVRVVVFGACIVFLLAAFALTSIRLGRAMLIPILIVVGFQGLNLVQYIRHFDKEPWRDMVEAASERYVPGTAMISISGALTIPALLDLYGSEGGPDALYAVVMTPEDLQRAIIDLEPWITEIDVHFDCSELQGWSSIMVVSRYAGRPLLHEFGGRLRKAGSSLLEEQLFRSIALQHWSPPSCDGQEPYWRSSPVSQ